MDGRQRGFRLVDGVSENVMILTIKLRVARRRCKSVYIAEAMPDAQMRAAVRA